MDAPYRIRPVSLADVAALVEIERACFSDPWTAAGIRETIQSETTRAFLAEDSIQAIGYVLARISGGEGEILDLAVLPKARRLGIGRRLLATMGDALTGAGVREAYLEVRESNTAAIALYQREGYRAVAMRPHYYRNPPEDALVLRASLVPRGIPGA